MLKHKHQPNLQMDKHNKVLKDFLNQLTSFVIEDKVVKSAMIDAQEKADHKQGVLPIERKSPSFEAQDPLEEVNLGTSDKPRTTKVSELLVKRDKNS